jgi:integrase
MPREPIDPSFPVLPYGAGHIWKENGKYYGRASFHGQRPKTAPYDDYMPLYDKMHAEWTERRGGVYIAPQGLTVRELVSQYLDQAALFDEWQPSTEATYRQRARSLIYPTFGEVKADKLDASHVQAWITKLTKARYAASTIDCAVRVLSTAYRRAVRLRVVRTNPCLDVRRPKIRTKETVTWTREEVARVDEALVDDPMWRAVYRVMLTTGMRPGELRALTWSDIDFAGKSIAIRRTVTKDTANKVVMGSRTKTDEPRAVSLSEHTAAILLQWRELAPLRDLNPDEDYIFKTPKGKFLPQTTWDKRHARLIAQSGVPRIRLHDMRHTSATLDAEIGAHPKVIQEKMGHKKFEFTYNRYIKASATLQAAAAEALATSLYGELPNEEANTGTTPPR